MQHSRSYIQSQSFEEAVKLLYNQIEELERKVKDLEDRIEDIEQNSR